jgi:ubiquinone/menaquinone biosynthesis C-methylase UbiE
MSYVYMRVLESAPERYDRGMRILTVGRLERVHYDIAARLRPGDRVLDVGCGTGMLVALLAAKGCRVTGVDISPLMLGQASQRLRRLGLEERATLRELGIAELDTAFADTSFDAVVSTLVFSELSDEEIRYMLAECRRILRPGGWLLVADEVLPDSVLGRVATLLARQPFAVLAFVLTQNTTHRVTGLAAKLKEERFRIVEIENYLAGTLRLFVAQVA